MALANGVDNLIVSHVAGLAQVAAYAVTAKVFAPVAMLVTVVNMPMWPACAAALARRDHQWVRRTAGRMARWSALTVGLGSLGMVVAGPVVMRDLLGVAVPVDRSLLAGFALWSVVLAALSARFMVQNAAGVVGPQLVGWSAYLLLSVPAKWFSARYLGVSTVPFAATATYLVTVLPGALVGYRRAMRR